MLISGLINHPWGSSLNFQLTDTFSMFLNYRIKGRVMVILFPSKLYKI